jgi:hypothetical protein
MQLVAYGAQDVYLTGNPKVTFFQAVYKRHTNFAMENIQQTVNGSAGDSGRVSVTIARNGDLVGNMYVALTPSAAAVANLTSIQAGTVFDTNWVAERAIASVELTIGGQRIDKHYQTWFRLYSECFLGESDKISYGKMTSMANPNLLASNVSKPQVFLPLLFFFNRNPGLYLPLIALQYHEVRLDFDLTGYYANYFGTNAFEVWANYIYLDTEERRKFAQKGHEYLIEQVQHTGGDAIATAGETSPQLIRLSFNHPVKELIWCYTPSGASWTTKRNAMWNFSTKTDDVNISCNPGGLTGPVQAHTIGAPRIVLPAVTTSWSMVEEGSTAAAAFCAVGPLHQFKLVLNGQDRFKEQSGKYFNQYQTGLYHTGTPYAGIYNYSFALQPEEHQPTGTCNFSRIDNAQVSVALKAASEVTVQKLFAVNYNILRIQSGMGGLAFSN